MNLHQKNSHPWYYQAFQDSPLDNLTLLINYISPHLQST